MVNKETIDSFIKRYGTCKEHVIIYTVICCVITFYFFLILNFRHVLNDVCILLGNSPASEFYMPVFRNTHTCAPMKMEQTECSETLAYKKQTPGNYPEESIHFTFCLLFLYNFYT